MSFDRRYTQESNPFKTVGNNKQKIKNVYWGEVVSTDDPIEGGRIKVKIPELDTQLPNENLPFAYPFMPKFFHVFPKVGEVVRIIIDDTTKPQSSRYWMGSVISQLQKVEFDSIFSALNTTNLGFGQPLNPVSSFPNAAGVFPKKEDIAIIGRDNTDLILREKEVILRAGKHSIDNVLDLNKENPASLTLTFEEVSGTTRSTALMLADKIALIAHKGNPKFKAANITQKDRERIINEAHPMARADVLVAVLEVFRRAILEHIHPYPKISTDRSGVITDLENLDLQSFVQENILIN